MIYTSVSFIFFLAFSLVAYSFASDKWRLPVIMLLSLSWYASWGWTPLFLLGSVSLLNYVLIKIKFKPSWFYPFLIVTNVLLFILLKSLNYWNHLTPTPYGTSFFMLLLIGYIISLWRNSEKELSFAEMHSYLFFFPALVNGPLERTQALIPQLSRLKPLNLKNLIDGSCIFAYGFLKKYFIANNLMGISQVKSDMPFLNLTTLAFYGILATFQAYLDFSSYCDMGRGAARLFGIQLSFNFRPFYYSSSPSDFWQRWNITLGTWIRDFISFPMMLKFGKKIGTQTVLIISFLLVGVWHGLTWNWFIFGLFNGLLVVLHLQCQKFTKSRLILAFVGLLGAWLIYIGNGVLQNPQFMEPLRIAFDNGLFHADWGLFIGSLRLHTGSFLLGGLLFLFIFEFFQEKYKNLDFYLKAPDVLKFLLASGFYLWILYLLYSRQILETTVLPPLYFQF